jgi:hypothetical protein
MAVDDPARRGMVPELAPFGGDGDENLNDEEEKETDGIGSG